MSDATPEANALGIDPNNPPQAKLLAHFTRDLSFENVGMMEGNTSRGTPEITVNVSLDAGTISETRYQINMKINAKAVSEEKTRFIAELDYAGVFELQNVKKEHVHPFLFIECPRLLLPFARRVLADVTRDGGYPPLMLDNVDFAQLYRQRVEQARAQKADQGQEQPAGQA